MAAPALAKLHDRERAFFDDKASRPSIGYLDHRILRRYLTPGTLFPREFIFRLLGDISGRTVLDVGCGEGQDAVLLTKLGARVTGVDLSSGAIDVARERVALNRCIADFVVAPVEHLSQQQQYDIVWVEALLHHVLHDLDNVVRSLTACVKPGGTIIMCEPVNLLPALRNLRLRVGPPPDATPDERPLEKADLAKIRAHLPTLQTRYFRVFGRLNRFVMSGIYEHASWLTRAAVKGIAIIDRMLVAIPGGSNIASVAVMWARMPKV